MSLRTASIALVAVLTGLGLARLSPGEFAGAGPVVVHQAQAAVMSRAEARQRAADLAELGRALFFEPALSASDRMSCATCHSPDSAFGPDNALAVQLGGGDMRQPGLRAAPSLTYLQVVPQFTEHFFDNEDDADEAVDNGPSGGLMWDGRADSGHAQAAFPLLSPFEMSNSGPDDVVARALGAGYGPRLQAIYGDAIVEDRGATFAAILKAFEVFEQDYRTFYPYSSKFDAYLAGEADLTPQEARGLEIYNDPEKGNCAGCHISELGNDGTPPQFTDFGLIALGLPRNPDIPANADPTYFDLGVCGPLRTDLQDHEEYCGLFRTPTLRNVALRKTFFHNGVFHTLRKAVEFYATRDTNPERWYPVSADGQVHKFDDLPPRYLENLSVEPPFNRDLGDPPAMSDAEIDDLVAFLETLTDGWFEPNKATQQAVR